MCFFNFNFNFYSFFEFVFLVIVDFYSTNYAINTKIYFLFSKQKNT